MPNDPVRIIKASTVNIRFVGTYESRPVDSYREGELCVRTLSVSACCTA